ncbi:MAG TPA: HEAT repeat domain-containing protein [Tepidisphaeraceae bacterium]|jgi:HEAT repeat protein|nr:HEAT repeat domain-containing protein [Tepidisphaeraceae bacterium]
MFRQWIPRLVIAVALAVVVHIAPAAPSANNDIHGVGLTFLDAADGKPLRVWTRSVAKDSEAARYNDLAHNSLILRIGKTAMADLANDAAVEKRLGDGMTAHEPLEVQTFDGLQLAFATLPQKKGEARANPTSRPFAAHQEQLKEAGIDKLFAILGPADGKSADQMNADSAAGDLTRKQLTQLGAKTASAQRALNAILEDTGNSSGKYIGTAADALALSLGDSDAAIDQLIAETHDPLDYIRAAAAGRLGELHHRPDKCVPALIETLKDSSWLAQASAASALANFGPDGKSAVAPLMTLLANTNTDASARAEAFESLSKLSKESGPAAIKIAMADHDLFRNMNVLKSIAGFGPAASAAVPALKALVDSKDEPECYFAADALKEIAANNK